MQHLFKPRRVLVAALAGWTSLLMVGPARADLSLAASCASVPLASEFERAAAAAALPTFAGTNQICVLQALLATVGDLPGSRTVDGRYDRQTRDALKAFQVGNALAGNGLLTPATMEALATTALDRIYAAEPIEPTAVMDDGLAADGATRSDPVDDAAAPSSGADDLGVEPTISETLAALELAAPTPAPVLNLAPVQSVIDLPTLATTQEDTAVAETVGQRGEAVLSSTSDGEGGTISRASSAVVVETTTIETVTTEEVLTTNPVGNPALTTNVVASDPVTTTTTTTVFETFEAPAPTAAALDQSAWGNYFDPLSDGTVSAFVEPSICHSPSHARDFDLLRNLDRLPVATCLRTFVGAGDLPYQVYSLEVSAGGQTIILMHDGDDAAFDAAIDVLRDFGGRMVVLQSDERTRTTLEGTNPEILTVSPSTNLRCDLRASEKPLAYAVHDYIVAGATPVLVLRQNLTGQSVLDRFSSGKQRFDIRATGPERELFDAAVEPLADDAFIELMVTSASRRSVETRMLVQKGVEAGMPVALTLVDALGERDQCSIEALALQTDLPITRVVLGKAKGAQVQKVLAAAYRAVGLGRRDALAAVALALAESATEEPAEEISAEAEIPASVLALAAGGLDADLSDDLSVGQSAPRTLMDALAPGLPPVPLDRPAVDDDQTLLIAAVETATNRAPTNRIVTGISAGTGVDALAPVALADAARTVSVAEAGTTIIEEAVGPVSALPPSPLLRPASDFAHRFIPDGLDPILAMDGEDRYLGTNFLGSRLTAGQGSVVTTGETQTLYTVDGQVYDPYAQPRVISSRTIQTTVNPYAPVSTTLSAAPTPATQNYGVPVTTYATPQVTNGGIGVSGPLYSNTLTNPIAPTGVTPGTPATETIIINNTIY